MLICESSDFRDKYISEIHILSPCLTFESDSEKSDSDKVTRVTKNDKGDKTKTNVKVTKTK